MSHLPRDIISAIRNLRDLCDTHGIESLRIELSERDMGGKEPPDHLLKFQIYTLGQWWRSYDEANDDDEMVMNSAWEAAVESLLEAAIKQAAEGFEHEAQACADRARAAELARADFRARAERARRLVPDVVTELGIISETAESAPDPTLEDLEPLEPDA